MQGFVGIENPQLLCWKIQTERVAPVHTVELNMYAKPRIVVDGRSLGQLTAAVALVQQDFQVKVCDVKPESAKNFADLL